MKEDHIIQKVFVEISVNNKEKALSIKDDIISFLSIDVFPEIEKYISVLEHQFAGHTLQIPKLELNLDIKNSTLNIELKDKITQIFKEELSEITDSILNSDQQTENNSEAYLIENKEKNCSGFHLLSYHRIDALVESWKKKCLFFRTKSIRKSGFL